MYEETASHGPQGAVGQRLPGGRLKSGPAHELIQSANRLEVANAPALYEGLSLADMAHVIMLMETGIAPWASGQELLAALLEAHATPIDDLALDPAWGDVYKNRERAISQRVPDVGGWLRTGRARREATNIAYRIAVRRRLLGLLAALVTLAETLVARAEEHVDTLMPDYTYLQQAQPTTLGHYLLGFAYPMLRDSERLRACFKRINLSPGGIGSVNGSRLPLDRRRLAELLGFDEIVHHARDAMWQADTPIEITSGAVTLLINLDRLAEDLQVWVTQEFNLVELADSYTRTSVIMPQKKNPYSLAYVRGLTNVTIMANVGRTPSGQPDNRIFAYGDVPRVLDQTTEAVQLMAGVTGTMQVNVALMAERLGLGYSQATDLADVIMLTADLPYQSAHRVVGQVVAMAVEAGIPAVQISVEMINRSAQACCSGRTRPRSARRPPRRTWLSWRVGWSTPTVAAQDTVRRPPRRGRDQEVRILLWTAKCGASLRQPLSQRQRCISMPGSSVYSGPVSHRPSKRCGGQWRRMARG
jgi:argininosuccinate lyase